MKGNREMGDVTIKGIECSGNEVKIEFDVSEDLKKFFSEECLMKITYTVDVSFTPYSIAVIPFLCNVLPIIWLTDSKIYVDELDKTFFENIENIKQGYRDMYPMYNFSGAVIVDKIMENTEQVDSLRTAMFFSGGVDAYTSLYRHFEEKPILVTVWGTDIKLTDKEGWNRVSAHTKRVAEEFGLEYLFIKSNFRKIVNERELDKLVFKSGDAYWHGFQCGIALIGHISLLVWKKEGGGYAGTILLPLIRHI